MGVAEYDDARGSGLVADDESAVEVFIVGVLSIGHVDVVEESRLGFVVLVLVEDVVEGDVVSRFLKREKMDSLEMVIIGPAITNLGRMDFPKTYGSLENLSLTTTSATGYTVA